MIWILLVAFACSAMAMYFVVNSAEHHFHWFADHDLDGPQKMHVKAVPRVGGIGILVGLFVGAGLMGWLREGIGWEIFLLLVCTLPAFGSGIWEDFTKAIPPRQRMIALAVSGLLGVLL